MNSCTANKGGPMDFRFRLAEDQVEPVSKVQQKKKLVRTLHTLNNFIIHNYFKFSVYKIAN